MACLPLLINKCLALIPDLVSSPNFIFGRSGNRFRAMKSDRQKNMIKVLSTLAKACSLANGGLFCHIDKCWVRPLSVPEIAAFCGICTRTVYRCLEDLKDMGLIECQQIKRKNKITGQLEVSLGIRRFTEKFWKIINLASLFKKSCEWAKIHCKRRLFMPFKGISLKLKKTFQSAGDLVKSVLGVISEDAIRVQAHCEAIRFNLRQRK